ncbi:MAG: hypothetical protein HC804_03260, partial [Anaerolineae bacterium]|nr:hypothetical protein [Anaerolineae bacterium]
MKRKDWIIGITAGLVLALIIVCLQLAGRISPLSRAVLAQNDEQTAVTNHPPVTTVIQPEARKVIEAMLNSYTQWATVQAEATTTWYIEGSPESSWVSRVMINQPTQVRFETSLAGGEGTSLWIMNGRQKYERDLVNDLEEQKILPSFATDPGALARLPSQIEQIALAERVIYRLPIGMLVPSPIADYIYPVGLAQRGGQYSLIGEEEVAGRKTWIL